MVDQSAKRVAVASPLLLALLGLLVPGLCGAALAPPKDELASGASSSVAGAPPAGADGVAAAAPLTAFQRALKALPSMRFGATVGYNMRRDDSEMGSTSQSGLETLLMSKANGYIWQPYIARYVCSADARLSYDKTQMDREATVGRSVSITGSAQLMVLSQTSYPFEAHYTRVDNRSTSDLATGQRYAGQSYGFSQSYIMPGYTFGGGWDRSTQNEGRDRQDVLRLNADRNEESQRIQAFANIMRNSHVDEGQAQSARQSNFSLLHNITPSDAVTLDNIASVSQSDYRLLHGRSEARATQLSSVAFWRPDEVDVTLVGGVRLLSMQNRSTRPDVPGGVERDISGRASNINANLGASYDAIEFTRISVSGNLNISDSNGLRQSSASQSLSASYQPESLALGKFAYYWSTGGTLSRRSSVDSAREATLQASHGLSRNIALETGPGISVSINQSVGLAARSVTSAERNTLDNAGGIGAVNADGVRKQISHSATASWTAGGESGSMSAQLGANDSRSIGVEREFYQSLNLQLTSNLASGPSAMWVGNLTTQVSRQSALHVVADVNARAAAGPDTVTSVNSSGMLSYQQQRLFGLRNLRLSSDLRLNGQALLPLFGGPQDQEMAAWDTRLNYRVGRTQLRLTFLVARNATPAKGVDQNGNAYGTRIARVNKSIAISISRAIGDL
jgi:hypothetical protein